MCGSSYKNIGVQKLLDAVVNILPSPDMRTDLDVYRVFGSDLCAKAFKVSHDKQKGPITFMRIYSGSLTKVSSLNCVRSSVICISVTTFHFSGSKTLQRQSK